MTAVLSLILILALSVTFTRIATILLVHTGLSREMARFQARSAFTGAGFTTTESENLVNHRVRRKVVSTLMLLGNAGIVTSITSLLLTFVGGDETPLWLKGLFLAVGVLLVWLASSSRWLDAKLSQAVRRALERSGRFRPIDYDNLLDVRNGYRVCELSLEDEDEWLANRNLGETDLRAEGVVVLAVHRADGSFVGVPDGTTRLEAGDSLICYGRTEDLDELDRRSRGRAGDRRHEQAVQEHSDERREQHREEFRHRLRQQREQRQQQDESPR